MAISSTTATDIVTPSMCSWAWRFQLHVSHPAPPCITSLFDWHAGSDSWSEVQYPDLLVIDQIVGFNEQLLLSDGFGSI